MSSGGVCDNEGETFTTNGGRVLWCANQVDTDTVMLFEPFWYIVERKAAGTLTVWGGVWSFS